MKPSNEFGQGTPQTSARGPPEIENTPKPITDVGHGIPQTSARGPPETEKHPINVVVDIGQTSARYLLQIYFLVDIWQRSES